MKIASLLKLSTIDYPGKLSAVVFTNGCNYTCYYCHNKELIDGRQPGIDTEEVVSFLKKRKNMLSGLVISGGEPTVQQNLIPFMQSIKEIGYKIKLDTNGSNPNILEQAAAFVDYIAIDFKAPEALYQKVCGDADYSGVVSSLRFLSCSAARWEIRTTLVPEITLSILETMVGDLKKIPMRNKPLLYRFNKCRSPDSSLPAEDIRRICTPLGIETVYQ